MTDNPYDEAEEEPKIWCPHQLSRWGSWFTPITPSVFIIYNWLKLKKKGEAGLALLWALPGVILLLNPPANFWYLFAAFIVYYHLWKAFSCKRQIRYADEDLYSCYEVRTIAPVILCGLIMLGSFYYYLTSTIGAPGFPNRAFVDKYKYGEVRLFVGKSIKKSYYEEFAIWIKKFNSENKGVAQYIHLAQVGEKVQVRMTIMDAAIKDAHFNRLMSVLTVEYSREVFSGAMTEIHLCDGNFTTRKIIQSSDAAVKHYFVQKDITILVTFINSDLLKSKAGLFEKIQGKGEIEDVVVFIENSYAFLKKIIKKAAELKIENEEVRPLHEKLKSLLDYEFNTYDLMFKEIIKGGSIDASLERFKTLKEKSKSFNEELSNFEKEYLAKYGKGS